MEIPQAGDISPTRGLDLDERIALDHFLGRTQSEAARLFFENPLYYESDLKWMGSKAFAYYLPATRPFLEASDSSGNIEFLDALISTIAIRLKEDPESIRASREHVLAILAYALKNIGKFRNSADLADLYGNVPSSIRKLIASVKALELE